MKVRLIILITMCLTACVESTTPLVQNALENRKSKVLFVVSNATHYGNTEIETTNNFPEIVFAYHEFVEANIEVDFVSPLGGQVPIGYIHSSNTLLQHYLFDGTLSRKLKNTIPPEMVNKNAYQAIYYVGGGSAMFGVPEHAEIQNIASHILENNQGILSAICHGTAGIANIKNNRGEYVIKGAAITGFPDAFEDTTAVYYKQFPFSIDKMINKRGAQFKHSQKGWDEFMITDGTIITGQDPTSAHLVAREIINKIHQKTN